MLQEKHVDVFLQVVGLELVQPLEPHHRGQLHRVRREREDHLEVLLRHAAPELAAQIPLDRRLRQDGLCLPVRFVITCYGFKDIRHARKTPSDRNYFLYSSASCWNSGSERRIVSVLMQYAARK